MNRQPDDSPDLYEQGWRDAIEEVAQWLETANVSPPDAKGHWINAAGAIRMLYERGELAPHLTTRLENPMGDSEGSIEARERIAAALTVCEWVLEIEGGPGVPSNVQRAAERVTGRYSPSNPEAPSDERNAE